MNKALLEYEMKRRGITANKMSEVLGIDRSTFSKKCNGQSEFKQSEIQRIIEYLNIDNPTPIFFDTGHCSCQSPCAGNAQARCSDCGGSKRSR